MKRAVSALAVALPLTALLAAGCSSSSKTSGAPSTQPSASASASSTPGQDPFQALAPPTSPGVGSFDQAASQRAYDATQGLLAQSLLDPPTLKGTDRAALASVLAVPDSTLSVLRYISGPTRRGLDIRPLFAKNVTLANPPAEVLSSSYTADEVQGRAGEKGLRITWTGVIRYHVTVGGEPRQMTYALKIAYVFGPNSAEPDGMRLVQVVPLSAKATPVLTSCLSKGVFLPTGDGPVVGSCPV